MFNQDICLQLSSYQVIINFQYVELALRNSCTFLHLYKNSADIIKIFYNIIEAILNVITKTIFKRNFAITQFYF